MFKMAYFLIKPYHKIEKINFMNKKLFTSIVFLFAISFSFAQKTKNHWQVANLKGLVKTSHIMEYAVNDDNTQGQKLNDMLTSFNNKGNITEMKVENEYLSMTFQSFYDKNDRFIENKGFLADGTFASHNKLTYNEKGYKTEERSFSAEGFLFQKFTYKHDSRGNEIEKNICVSEEHCNQQITYTYDANDNLISEQAVNKLTGKISDKKVYAYDAENKRIQTAVYNQQDELMEKIVYAYDNFGNVTEESVYDAFGTLEEKKTYIYTYDKNNNWLTKVVKIENTPIMYSSQKLEYF